MEGDLFPFHHFFKKSGPAVLDGHFSLQVTLTILHTYRSRMLRHRATNASFPRLH